MIGDLPAGLINFFEASLAVSLLIVLVLAVRGPVARRFGPRAAYALWLLPLVRLAMPPVPLPANIAPDFLASPEPTEFVTLEPVERAAEPAPIATVEPTAPVSAEGPAEISYLTDTILPADEPAPAAVVLPAAETEPAAASVTETMASMSARIEMASSDSDSARTTVTVAAPREDTFEVSREFRAEPAVRAETAPRLAPTEEASGFLSGRFLPTADWGQITSRLWQAFALLWMVVAGGIALRMLVSQFLFADRTWQNTIPADDQTAAEARAMAKEFGVRQPITVRLCPNNEGPFVCGLFRPIVVLPEDFGFRFSPEERRFALAHELLHVRRGDLFAIVLMTAVRSSQWFNPFAHKAVDAFRADQEAACDATVLRQLGCPRAEYAQTLLKAVSPTTRGPVPALTLEHGLKQRLKLMNIRKTLRGGAAVVTGVAVLGLASTASYAVQEKDELEFDELEKVLEGAEGEAAAPRDTGPRAEAVRERVMSVQAKLAARASGEDPQQIARAEIARVRREEAQMRRDEMRQRERELEDRRRELADRKREAADRQREAKQRAAEMARDAEERARDLRLEAEEFRQEQMEAAREQAEEASEWASDLREEMAQLSVELQEETRDIARMVSRDIKLSMSNGSADFSFGNDDHGVMILGNGDKSVHLNSAEGKILLTSPMAGLEDRMAALENFSPEIPEMPEPPTPPEVTVVEVTTSDGRKIKVPEMTIVLPGMDEEMEAYAAEIERVVASADIDKQVQDALGEDFDERVAENTEILSQLSSKCDARIDSGKSEPVVLTKTKNGTAHKLLCFNPEKTQLKSAELKDYVEGRDDLTEEEKARFMEARSGGSFAFSFSWSD